MNANPDDSAFGYPILHHIFGDMKSTDGVFNHFAALIPATWVPWILHCGLLPKCFVMRQPMTDQVRIFTTTHPHEHAHAHVHTHTHTHTHTHMYTRAFMFCTCICRRAASGYHSTLLGGVTVAISASFTFAWFGYSLHCTAQEKPWNARESETRPYPKTCRSQGPAVFGTSRVALSISMESMRST
jgi:hypothetical protein